MRAAEVGVEALAEDHPVAHDHGADERIGTYAPGTARGELDRPCEVKGVGFKARGHHSNRILTARQRSEQGSPGTPAVARDRVLRAEELRPTPRHRLTERLHARRRLAH